MRVDVSNQLKPDVFISMMHFMKIAFHKIRSCFAIWVVRFLNHRRLIWVQLGLSSALSLGSRMEREARTVSVFGNCWPNLRDISHCNYIRRMSCELCGTTSE